MELFITHVKAPTGGGGQPSGTSGSKTTGGETRKEETPVPSGTLQRAAYDGAELATVPPIVYDELRAPGQPLDLATRIFMEQRFGHDFSQVHIHTDARAAESAEAVHARAYTVGRDVVFGAGQYAPSSADGRRLLAHELTHVVQQASSQPVMGMIGGTGVAASPAGGDAEAAAQRTAEAISANHAVPAANRHAVALYRQSASLTSSSVSLTREEFAKEMRRRFGMVQITVGSQAEQEAELTTRGRAPRAGVILPNWQQWDPGSSSQVYSAIINALDNFNQAVGGVPNVREVIFFATAWELNAAGVGVPQPDVGATYGAGTLTVYSSAVTKNKALPISRSNPQGKYPPVGLAVGGIPGQTPGAPLPLSSQAQSTQRVIAHELGHGLAEAAMGPNPKDAIDPGMMSDYQRAVGWTAGSPFALYDVGVAAVATALQAGAAPPATYQITVNDWNAPKWVEQPVSHYSVAGGPPEDFAEAVMAFVYEPNLLLSRSPHRFKFLYDRKKRWLPRLLKPPVVGDFPEPKGDTRVV